MYVNKIFAEKISEELTSKVLPHHPENLYAPINYILHLSGKRIRPLLVLLGADLFGIENIDDALPASVAIEYFHNFSLIHDDIMDKAPLRRGQQTVHQKWNDNVAILSGDALLIKAYEQLSQCPAPLIPDLLRVFNRIALEVCEGQQLDMDFETSDSIMEEEYIQMIRLKTSVLLGGALEMGAILAGASSESRRQLYDFGVNLGIAFQLQDDILDAFGDPATFGKQVGGDIIANKKTILYILLGETIHPEDQAHFENLLVLGQGEASEKITGIITLYEKYAIQQKADTLKQHYTALAYKSLEAINIDHQRKTELYELANQLMKRVR
ncbi:polyprenyl synthetase family protein [Sphingobacterium sp. SGG-5]|uniref:polyprenyl synthetase family protein n=1 Tax=Sphingobacterium sp. SGG-5 TaxID=2710881 RepID=UPI0013EC97C2|nr:polyprenyl synthetase family protein [Sphingobacterium sp. SGG-5]NGM60508.1 polyprenyl synthetase family protein [Sphingobacterium sp. SGG-5]